MPIDASGYSLNVTCDRCPQVEFPPPRSALGFGQTKAQAYHDLKRRGWKVAPRACVCPVCNRKKEK